MEESRHTAADAPTSLRALVEEVERRGAALRGRAHEQVDALTELAARHDELLSALRRCHRDGRSVDGLRLIAALARFWWIRGLGPAVQDAVDLLLASAPSDIDPRALAAARQGAGELAYARADYDVARREFERAADSLHELTDLSGEAHAINFLGMVDREQGRLDDARARHERARELFETADDAWGRAHAISNLGVVASRRGELAAALGLHRQALELRRALDDLHGVSSSYGNLALLHRRMDNDAMARDLYRASLEARVRLDDVWGVAGSSVALSALATQLGERDEALEHLRTAVAGFIEVGDSLGIAESAAVALELFVQLGQHEAAADALAIAEATRTIIKAPPPLSERRDGERLHETIKQRLGDEALRSRRDWAQRATLDELRARLRELVGPAPGPKDPRGG